MKLLVTTDGSKAALGAVRYAIGLARQSPSMEIHLLNVQPPLPGAASKLLDTETVKSFHQEEGAAALAAAQKLMETAAVKYEAHIAVGAVAEAIAGYAGDTGCDQIVMSTRGHGAIENLLLGSTTQRVLQLTNLPVTLVK
jgi:nucleotide-binding universal stress UspA family protein